MNDGFTQLDDALQGLIAAAGPTGRRRVLGKVAQQVRRENVKRITRNVGPDGQPFAPRLKQKAEKGQKRLRKKMFTKLKSARWLKLKKTDREISLRFVGGAGKLAAVHHFGLRDRVSPGVSHKYAARPLLGFSKGDEAAIEEMLLRHLEDAL
jgi:phage virion morphogenesis protein